MTKYKLRKLVFPDSSVIEDVLDTEKTPNVAIPIDPLNTDYAAFLEWKSAGGVPDPAD